MLAEKKRLIGEEQSKKAGLIEEERKKKADAAAEAKRLLEEEKKHFCPKGHPIKDFCAYRPGDDVQCNICYSWFPPLKANK